MKGRDHGSIGPGHPSIFSYFNAQNEEVLVLNNHYYRNIPSTPDVAFVSFVEHHILRLSFIIIYQFFKKIHFSFVNDWPVVYHDEKWNPMEYWNRSGTTTTQASTVSTSGKPTTPNPTSGEHTIFNLFIQKYIIAVIFYNIIYFVFIVCDITSVNSRCCIECSKVFENCQFYDS